MGAKEREHRHATRAEAGDREWRWGTVPEAGDREESGDRSRGR